jgi:hypothetical protein
MGDGVQITGREIKVETNGWSVERRLEESREQRAESREQRVAIRKKRLEASGSREERRQKTEAKYTPRANGG